MKHTKWRPRLPYEKLRAVSDRLEVRPFRASDFPEWQAAHLRLDDKKRNRFDTARPPRRKLSEKAYKAYCARLRKNGRAKKFFAFGVFDRKTGAHLGGVDFFVFSPDLRWANLGYAIHHHFWGHGFASEAARLALQIGFGPLHLHRIEASCEPDNLASAGVARKAGLEPEGMRKKFFPHKGGIDLLVFGLNAIDYKKRKACRK